MFSKIFIERPKLAMVISIVMVLAGILCVKQIPVAEYPEISPPQLYVFATYPGASCQVIADTLGAPLEEEMAGLDGLQYFSSDSSNDGLYTLAITFLPDTDIDMAQVDVQNALKRVESKLPQEVVRLGINVYQRSSDMLGMYAFTLNDDVEEGMDMLKLSNYLRTNVKDELIRIPGLSQVDVMGTSQYAMRIWLDTTRMSSLGITTSEISGAINDQNIAATAGAVGTENSNEYLQYKVNAVGRLQTVEEFENIVIRSNTDGRMIKLKDIATVELASEDYSTVATYDNEPVLMVTIYRNASANAISVVDNANKKLAELEKFFPKGVEYHMGYDPTEYIRITMEEIIITLILTLVLVVQITYLFLQNWRATLIPTLTIPVSILGTFVFLFFMGYSLNLLTMFGLILVIGSLVDDAIVVVENVIRLMDDEKLSPKDATIKSMQQITGAIIATTLVVLAIYVPIGFYGGMVGKIYLQFSVTMCVALVLSTVNALTLSPALCVILLKPKKELKRNIFAPFDMVLEWSKKVYLFFVNILVRNAWLTIILFVGVCAGAYFMFNNTLSSFIPEEDKGVMFCTVELDAGASLARTQKVVQDISNKITPVPGVKEVLAVSGYSMLGGKGENMGFAVIALKDWDFRTTPETTISNIMKIVQGLTYTIPEASIRVIQPPAIMGLGATGGVTFKFQAKAGQTPAELETAVQSLLHQLNALPETMMAFTTFNANTPQIFLDIDREKAKAMQIPVSRIFGTLQTKLSAGYINDFTLDGYAFQVKLQANAEDRSTLDSLLDINILSDSGKMIPLSSFATLSYTRGPRIITRFNNAMSASVTVMSNPGVSSGFMMDKILEIQEKDFQGYQVAWTDMSYQEQGNEGKLVILMSMALIFAYLFLVGQYESWTMPLSVILSVSVAILGALIGLWLWDMSLSIYAQLGLIMLIGLAGKNAILMAEFSKQAREEGMSIQEAAMQGGNVRYRAVLMTAWSFIIGVFPMVIASGAGAGSRQAIGVTTFSGMVLATLVGIIFVPPLFALFQRMREFVKGLFHKIGI